MLRANARQTAFMQLSDKELIRKCRKGKRRFQEELYRRYYGFCMSVCLRYTTNREDALEVLNDSFMKVFDNLDSYDLERPFTSWLRRILVNTALDAYRRAIRHKLVVSHDNFEEIAESTLQDEEPGLSVEEIMQLFNRLPDMLRMTYNLYEIEGYSHEEIAGILDISPGTSRSNLSRAKKTLRAVYTKYKNNTCHEAV